MLWEALCSLDGRPKHWLGAAMTGQHGDVRRAVASGWFPSTGLGIRRWLLFFVFFFLICSSLTCFDL